MITVVLSYDEVISGVSRGETIDSVKRDYNSSRNWSSQFATHVLGCLGEIAYGKLVGKRRDSVSSQGRELKAESPEGDKADFDETVDVKAVTWTGPDAELKMPPEAWHSKPWIRLFVMVKISKGELDHALAAKDSLTTRIVGQISRERFDALKTLKDYGHGPHYMVNERELEPIMAKRRISLEDWV